MPPDYRRPNDPSSLKLKEERNIYEIFTLGDGMMSNMERILACVSSAPSSRNVVRKAMEMASQLNARVVAVHVQSLAEPVIPTRDQKRGKVAVEQNLDLARAGGAEVVVIRGNDIARAIIEYAELSRVTRIVVGKNERPHRGRVRQKPDLAQRLITETTQTDLYVVPGDPSHYRPRSHVKRRFHLMGKLRLGDTLITCVLILSSSLVSLVLRNVGFADANIVMVFLLAVLSATFFVGRLQGIVSSVLGVLSFNFLFTEPRFTLVVYDTQYILTFSVMLLVSLTTSELLSRVRSEAAASRRRADLTVAVYRLTRTLLTLSGETAVVTEALEQLVRNFGGSAFWFRGDPGAAGNDPLIRHDAETAQLVNDSQIHSKVDRDAAAWAFSHNQTAGFGTTHHPQSAAIYVPLLGATGTVGVLGAVVPDAVAPEEVTEQRTLLETFAAQVALAFERERLARQHEEVSVQVEAERLRNYLLRSISHDLRTPLAGIGGSAAVLADLERIESVDQVRELANDIYAQATWLIGLVENLLSLTRIESESPSVHMQMETVDDLVGSVLARMQRRLRPYKVGATLPDTVVSAPMDGGLIQQVLLNLLENACRHAPEGSKITIVVTPTVDQVVFRVCDEGPGFSDHDLAHLFEKFYTGRRRDADASRGVGLGLAICRAIVDAHGGWIDAQNSSAGGAQVSFGLPLTVSSGSR